MIIKQKWIMREDLQNNPTFMYLFGDNMSRFGLGGQAKEMRGEPNAIGIATKKLPKSTQDSYFTDDEYMDNVKVIYNDMLPAMLHIMKGGILVIPTDGLGTGLSDLPNKAPKTNKALEDLLEYLHDLDARYNDEE